MNKAKAIFAKATSRKEFIEQAAVEGLSKHCAATYYQNLKNEAKGECLYKYNKNVVSARSANNAQQNKNYEIAL